MGRAVRIIPAYAGSTPALRRSGSAPRDHPRIRGEHLNERAARQRRKGSSPHTRGARWRTPVSPGVLGIIPAYAGSTSRAPLLREAAKDHPRIRGEHCRRPSTSWRPPGSSPHTRGARPPPPGGLWRSRIIPAYAGSTLADAGLAWCVGDHPRIRGEHRTRGATSSSTRGSSPHTRGALPRRPLVLEA